MTEAEWSVVLTDDREVRELSRTYRAIDATTDVLSFPMGEGVGADLHPALLGDVVISVEQAARQAPEGDLEAELSRLMVHGLCHLRGLDHADRAGARAMRAEERRLLEEVAPARGVRPPRCPRRCDPSARRRTRPATRRRA